MVKGTIIIFVKAPVPGTVKTRLIPEIGAERAAELYRAMAVDTLAVARQASATSVTIAYQSHPEYPTLSWMANDVHWSEQQGTDLGERLIRATARVFDLRREPVLVIGSDLPTLTPSLLSSAFDRLSRVPVVIGPAQDGGYYLIGLTRSIPFLFQGISWSTPVVLQQTKQVLEREQVSAEYLHTAKDLDTPEDLKAIKMNLQALTHFAKTRSILSEL